MHLYKNLIKNKAFLKRIIIVSLVSIIFTITFSYYFISNNVSIIPKHKLIGTWELQSIEDNNVENEKYKNISKQALQQLFGKYIVFEKNSKYFNSSNGIELPWQYGNGFVMMTEVSGKEYIFSTSIKGGLLGKRLEITKDGYTFIYSKCAQEYIYNDKLQNKVKEEYNGKPVSINKVLSNKGVVQKYNLMSEIGQESTLVFYTDNTYACLFGKSVNTDKYREYNMENNDETTRNDAYLDNIEVYQGKYCFDVSQVYLFDEEFNYDNVYTKSNYLYCNKLDGLVLYKDKQINAIESSGYLLEAEVVNNITGITYEFFVDGKAKVYMNNGDIIDYTYTVDKDGLIEMTPRSAINTSERSDYLFFEVGTGSIYRNVYRQNSWLQDIK